MQKGGGRERVIKKGKRGAGEGVEGMRRGTNNAS